jgi:hypothetical protein
VLLASLESLHERKTLVGHVIHLNTAQFSPDSPKTSVLRFAFRSA